MGLNMSNTWTTTTATRRFVNRLENRDSYNIYQIQSFNMGLDRQCTVKYDIIWRKNCISNLEIWELLNIKYIKKPTLSYYQSIYCTDYILKHIFYNGNIVETIIILFLLLFSHHKFKLVTRYHVSMGHSAC